MAREDLHFRLRIPEELKKLVEDEAKTNNRSMTAEIIARLQNSFDNTRVQLPLGLRDRVQNAAKISGRSLRDEVVSALDKAYPPPQLTVGDLINFFENIQKDAEGNPPSMTKAVEALKAQIAKGEIDLSTKVEMQTEFEGGKYTPTSKGKGKIEGIKGKVRYSISKEDKK
ncbi:Arc family DNA-binding protein [Ahrensia kielensis]|uniref:Arc family DNA-binding protein n=1 Tax=Ahrensia kielensis TaxID=76980 RepID=UPI00036AAEB2|nr:Arc family DNA-binding protein [Ahrensia kielensis]